jgi:putative membrane-bound dehydrogenase-like protein
MARRILSCAAACLAWLGLASLAAADPAFDETPLPSFDGVHLATFDGVHMATFDVDATPPVGTRMAYDDVVREADLPLRCRGIVLLGAGPPIVLCAVDWIGIGNAAHDAFRATLAAAAGTTAERVAVHALHQHDAPHADFTAEAILAELGVTDVRRFDGEFPRRVMAAAAAAVREALPRARRVTHAGFGASPVAEVASNRRLIGADGLIGGWRASATRDATLRAEPEGTIDPLVTTLGFWAETEPLAVLTAYATHPQSYYRTGVPSPDFPGIARFLRSQDLPTALHVHFTGAAGNVAAGKYNDGGPANRILLATRLAAAMRRSFAAAEAARRPLEPADVGFAGVPVVLEPRAELDRERLVGEVRAGGDRGTFAAVDALAWATRASTGRPILVTCLRVGDVRMLHLPGELFVEYQLAAREMRPDLHVMLAAYGDYGPGYIGTARAYDEGGYEVRPTSSFVGPAAESKLLGAMRELLEAGSTAGPAAVDTSSDGASRDDVPTDGAAGDYAAELPRIPQVPAGEARDTIGVAPGFALELMAAEPLLASPVAIAWDEDGRLFVAEMRGYSEHRDERLGRVRLLHDDDGDGRPDRGTVFADDLAWPTAVCCHDGGIFVGDAPDILFLRDTDGDGIADERRVVFTGFGTGNVQGLLNSFAFGLDGRIHGAVSSAGGTVRRVGPSGEPEGPAVSLSGRDFSFDPWSLELRPETGGGQHGRSFDDGGGVYVCSNSDHAIRCMIDDRFLGRNPAFTPPSGRESIAREGPQAEVFRASPVEPWRILRTRLRASGIVPGVVEGGGRPAGYFTSASGITVVRGDACGELRGCLVVGDVGSNLVHRKRLVPHGVGVRAERIDRGSELLASRDVWFRPVQFANAPDGGLWVVDMQREVIEHPASLAPPIKRHLDLTSGRDTGRLWRLAATEGRRRPAARLSGASTDELVALLDHDNGWHRDTAHRLLLTRRDPPAAVPALRRLLWSPAASAVGRQHAAFALASLGALGDDDLLVCLEAAEPIVRAAGARLTESRGPSGPSPAIVARLVALADTEPDIGVRLWLALVAGGLPERDESSEPDAAAGAGNPRMAILHALLARDGEDPWCRVAAFTSLPPPAAATILETWLGSGSAPLTHGQQAALPGLFGQIARRSAGEQAAVIEALAARLAAADTPAARLDVIDLVADLAAAVSRAGGDLGMIEPRDRMRAVLDDLAAAATAVAVDRDAPVPLRSRAVRGMLLDPAGVPAIAALASTREPSAVSAAAVSALAESRRPEATDALVLAAATLDPPAATPAVAALLRDPPRTLRLLEAIASGRLGGTVLDRQQAAAVWRFPDPAVRARAAEVLGPPPPADRGPLVAAYRASLPEGGDAAAGRRIFTAHCSGCHRVDDVGRELAPNLVAMQSRGADAVLLGILDPNREVLPAYVAHTVVTADGRVRSGIVVAESATSLTLRTAEGVDELLARDEIESLVNTGQSLMPEGFERSIDPRGMADLLAFLMSAR